MGPCSTITRTTDGGQHRRANGDRLSSTLRRSTDSLGPGSDFFLRVGPRLVDRSIDQCRDLAYRHLCGGILRLYFGDADFMQRQPSFSFDLEVYIGSSYHSLIDLYSLASSFSGSRESSQSSTVWFLHQEGPKEVSPVFNSGKSHHLINIVYLNNQTL
jgi:hypothetical protein